MSPIFISIDLDATGRNIVSFMSQKGLQVRDVQEACGFEKPQAVYKWIHGQTLPSIDNLLVLTRLFDTTMEDILAVSGDVLPLFIEFVFSLKIEYHTGAFLATCKICSD